VKNKEFYMSLYFTIFYEEFDIDTMTYLRKKIKKSKNSSFSFLLLVQQNNNLSIYTIVAMHCGGAILFNI
jgi:hypothetical protein